MGLVIGYLAVEGPHDLAVVQRLLKYRSFEVVRKMSDLERLLPDSGWINLIPKIFPHNGDLNKRHPVPWFHVNENDQVIVIESAEGISKLANSIVNVMTRQDIPFSRLPAWGIIIDEDDEPSALDRLMKMNKSITDLITEKFSDTGLTAPNYPLPTALGNTTSGSPRCEYLVIPDNNHSGTLEDPLIQAAGIMYPKTLTKAKLFVNSVSADHDNLNSAEIAEFQKPAGSKKAILSAICAILKPGKTIQTTITDHRWVSSNTISVTDLLHIDNFLARLFGI